MSAADDRLTVFASSRETMSGLQGDVSVIAHLAFNRANRPAAEGSRHLALLTSETLELDLSDPAQRQFGNYELLELIGEGGMGVVYRARQSGLDREVAVKLLAAGPWASRDFIERFQREAQNAARMQHPNIVAIYEVGDNEELHFFSMRLIRGPSLAAEVRRLGRLPPARAAQLLRTIAEAVDYAHRLGVLHLDLKPANVLIDESGVPHVADFGLARRLEEGLAMENNEVSGTPSYMAPEQATAGVQKITPATDIWGLGAILYELVTGEPPFVGGTPHATLRLVVEGSVASPRQRVPDLSRDLEAIILKCMARNIGDRYASARELADDLTRFIEFREVKARPLNVVQRANRWARREPKLAFTALLALVALLAGLAASTYQRMRAEDNAQLANERLWQTRLDQAASALRDDHPFAALPGLAANISEREALGLDTHDDRLRTAMISRSAPQLIDAIAIGAGITGVALSPDGKLVAASSWDATIRLFDTATGTQKWSAKVTGVPFLFTPNPVLDVLRFTPDGQRILGLEHWGGAALGVPSPAGEFEALFDAATGKQLLPRPEKFPRYYDAIFSPDGEYAIVEGEDETTCLMRTSDWSALSPRLPLPRSPWRIGSGGRHVVSLIDGFRTLQFRDPHTLKIRSSHTYAETQSISSWATSPDGNTLLVGHADGLIERIDMARETRERITPSALSRIGWVAFSADGLWFGAVSDTGEVLVWDSATRRPAIPLLHLDAGPGRHRQQLILDPTHHQVLASNSVQMASWSTQSGVPRRISGEFPHALPRELRAFDYAATDLVATGGDEGELRLWRLPRGMPNLSASASPGPALSAPDATVVAVDENKMHLARARDGSSVSGTITLPQGAAFAELTADGRALVAVAGPLLYVYDMPDAALRFTPVTIRDDPARVALSPDSRHAFVIYGDYRDNAPVDVARVWDLVSGRAVSEEIAGTPCDQIEYAPDGRTLLTCSTLRDATSLRALWTYGPASAALGDTATPLEITRMHFAAGGSEVLALATNEAADDTYLLRLDIGNGSERERQLLRDLRRAENFAMLPDRSVIVQRPDAQGPVIWREKHSAAIGESRGMDELNVLALAPDARTFARGTRRGVVLTSTQDARWITPELSAGLNEDDSTLQLAYTLDGRGVVARSSRGRWLYWDAAPDARPASELLRVAELLHPNPDLLPQQIAPQLAAAERAALRRADTGPAPPMSAGAPFTIPPRQDGLSPLLFDLTSSYNKPIAAEKDLNMFAFNVSQFVPGVHRLLGVDYDARGEIELSQGETLSGVPFRVAGVRPGVARFAALNVLVSANGMLRTQEQVPYAFVELEYRDGGRARLPIIYNRDIKEWWRTVWDTPGRIAWRLRDYGTGRMGMAQSMVTVRLANPHPQREVASVALEAVKMQFSSPAFFAITAEPIKD
jgi:WD40 repeat protein